MVSGARVWIPIEIPRLGWCNSIGSEIGPCCLKSLVKSVVAGQGSVAHLTTDLASGPWAGMRA